VSTSDSPKWSHDTVAQALAAVPSQLKTDEHEDAFRDAVTLMQGAPNRAAWRKLAPIATREITRVVEATRKTRSAKRFDSGILFSLKMLASTGTPESAAFIARVVRSGYQPDHYLWSVVLEPFGMGHVAAEQLFRSLSKPLPDKFIAISLLDAANSACREHSLKTHPFDSSTGETMLAKFLSSRRADHESYAVSACAAIPFLAIARRKRLLAVARKHKSVDVQIEAAWAGAKVGENQALDYLCEKCLHRDLSLRAQHYLSELGYKRLIPKAAKSRDFVALAKMCDWLSHPNEYGAPPDAIELMDKRTIHWPPARKERELRLFKFSYKQPHGQDEPVEGVGMVGSITWAFFEDTNPAMPPEHIYGMHCCWELSMNDDPRAPEKHSGPAGWKLITTRA
jgi:hypothetical protein